MTMRWLVGGLCATTLASAYTLSVDSTSIPFGTYVNVSWDGTCQVPGRLGCYDWISKFEVGNCNGTDGVGANTCYSMGKDNWAWITHPVDTWKTRFDSPGLYEFRIVGCNCTRCSFTDVFARCDTYPGLALSHQVTVNLPWSLAGYSPAQRWFLGLVFGLSQDMDTFARWFRTTKPDLPCWGSLSKLPDALTTAAQMFRDACRDFKWADMMGAMFYLEKVYEATIPTMTTCGLDKYWGEIIKTVKNMTIIFTPGLTRIERAVELAWKGADIFPRVVNALTNAREDNMFASGVNGAKIIQIVLSTHTVKRLEVAMGGESQGFMSTEHAEAEEEGKEMTWVWQRVDGRWFECDGPEYQALSVNVPCVQASKPVAARLLHSNSLIREPTPRVAIQRL